MISKEDSNRPRRGAMSILMLALAMTFAGAASAFASGVTFTEANNLATRTFAREPRFPANKIVEAEKELPATLLNFISQPVMTEGVSGIVVFDYDNDGDQDIYVTNGHLGAKMLFQNQLVPTGSMGFVDVAGPAGISEKTLPTPFPPPPGGVSLRDGFGACAGDIDNDGDKDLLVLHSNREPNSLYKNMLVETASATFTDISMSSGIGTVMSSSSSCTMGDVDNDGDLDLYIGNSLNFNLGGYGCFIEDARAHIEHDELWINQGGNVFAEEGAARGIQALNNRGMTDTGIPEITWAVAAVDYDQDGDIDIVTNSDNCAVAGADQGGADRGFFRVLANDGTGNFSDDAADGGFVSRRGAWMGIAAGDLNCDGNLDFFGSNFGDHGFLLPEDALLNKSSTVFLGTATPGALDDQCDLAAGDTCAGLGNLPFGWGNGILDYDNDGDLDIVFYGGLEHGPNADLSNPGMILENDGSCTPGNPFKLKWDKFANRGPNPAESIHTRRDERGLALGDLDGNGFVDIISVPVQVVPASVPLDTYPAVGSVVDGEAKVVRIYARSGDQLWLPTGNGRGWDTGRLVLEMASWTATNPGGNPLPANKWVKVKVVGDGTTVNRDGIGAVVRVTPTDGAASGHTVSQPVVAGSSHASQHSVVLTFGLANGTAADVEVLWPGGAEDCDAGVAAGSTTTVMFAGAGGCP